MSSETDALKRRGTPILLAVLAVWGLAVCVAAPTGLYGSVYPLLLGGVIALGVVLPVVVYAASKGFRAYIEAIGLRGLTSFHVWRIAAALLFFWYGARDLLPEVFVRNAGWGDLIAGLLAVGIILLPKTRNRYLVFHIFGFADFVIAVGTGLTLFLLNDPRMAGIQTLPMALIPFYGVGISGASHLMAFDLLRRGVGWTALSIRSSPKSEGAVVRTEDNEENGMSLSQSTIASVMVGLLLSVMAISGPTAAKASEAGGQAAAPAPASADSSSREEDAWFENYRFRSGETLDRVKIHYMTLGTPHRNATGEIDNAVLVLHWTGANSGALTNPIFRKALFDPGRPLDATRYYLILPDSVGHGASSKPSDGQRTRFPKYDYGDMVDLQHKLVTETLGIRHLHAIVGLSMGGMNAWQWAEAYPGMMDGIMPIVSLPMPVSGRNLLWRRMAIDTIVSDPDWRNGSYTEQPRQWVHGYRVLRLMIDSASALQGEVPDAGAADRFLAETLVQAEHIDANDFLYSLRSSFSYDPEPQLSAITTKVFALNFGDDEFNPDELQVLQRTVPRLRQGRYVVQPGTRSSPGHLTMTRPDLWAQHVGEFMRWLGDAPNEPHR